MRTRTRRSGARRFTVSAALALCSLAAHSSAAERPAPIEATVTDAAGEVWVSTGPGAPEREGEKGQKIAPGSRVRTGRTGAVALLFEDGTALRADRETHLQVKDAERQSSFRKFLVQMLQGRLLANVPKRHRGARAKFKVRTPIAVAAVRGTAFVTDASTGSATVAVYEGGVDASAPASTHTVTLAVNQETRVPAGGEPDAPRPLSAEMADYRDSVAALFAAQIDVLRSDMDAVRQMQDDYMERHRREIEGSMEDYRESLDGLMNPGTP